MRALRPLRVHIFEETQDDAWLTLHKLCQAHFEHHGERMQTENDSPSLLDQAPAAPEPALPSCAREISSPQPLRILLVEDNRDTLLYLAWELGQRRYTVRTAAKLNAARKLAASEEFDLLISDIELPDGTGLELMREITRTRGFPGIAISGLGSEDDIRMSQAAGFVAHLPKPIIFQTLEATIRRVFSADAPARSLADPLNNGARMNGTGVRPGA
jgi:CheY-like chemotaxis protein